MPRLHFLVIPVTGGDVGDDVQANGVFVRGIGHIGAAERKAVHGAVVKGGYIDIAGQVDGGGAPVGFDEVDIFLREGLDLAQDNLLRLIDGDELVQARDEFTHSLPFP